MEFYEHSTSALRDEKVRMIIDKFGLIGKGLLDSLFEFLGEEHERYFVFQLSPYNMKILEANVGLSKSKIIKILEYFVELNLFSKEFYDRNLLFSINFFKKHFKYLQKIRYNFMKYQKFQQKISEIPSDYSEKIFEDFLKYLQKFETINLDFIEVFNILTTLRNQLLPRQQLVTTELVTTSQTTKEKEKEKEKENVYKSSTPEKETTPELEKYSPESTPYQYASELIELVKINFQNIPTPNIQKWAKEFDLLFRIDKIPEAEVRKVMQWALTEGFWRTIIRSARKFRDKFGTIKLQMERKNGINQNSNKQPRDYQQVANEIEATSHRW